MTQPLARTDVARVGFVDLQRGRDDVLALAQAFSWDVSETLKMFRRAAEPDVASSALREVLEREPSLVASLRRDQGWVARIVNVMGASRGLAEFLIRHPQSVAVLADKVTAVPSYSAIREALVNAVEADNDGFSGNNIDLLRDRLRRAYRDVILRIASYDVDSADSGQAIDEVTAALADAAGCAIDASLMIARTELAAVHSREAVRSVRLAVIGMGKCGARELNYVSDVDVIYVVETADEELVSTESAVTLGTKLAQATARGIQESGKEPGLWEVDPNLRPEGKAGALVRTLESHLVYYERWAKNWEFQALLKARPLAGDSELGARYVAGIAPKIWSSASRAGFVDQVQRMRERVTENIPPDEVEYQIKLGPGGLRDVEFTVQLLQLVHGQQDDRVRLRGTLESLEALSDAGYVGREEAAVFAESYRFLRLLEHRLQLRFMRRTHLMPQDAEDIRVLSRSLGIDLATGDIVEQWRGTKRVVRELHERLFYRPLLAAVATIPEEGFQLTTEQAEARLAAIGFDDAKGALAHLAALTSGVSRRSDIQRALLPVLLEWLAAGADPGNGLLAFRRLSETLGESPWFLRMLRDSQAAAERLMQVLSGSRYVSDLLERFPEATAWLDDEGDRDPRPLATLDAEVIAILGRHDIAEAAAKPLKHLRRREVLRLAIGAILGEHEFVETSQGITDVSIAVLRGLLDVVLREEPENPEFAIVAMGRFGGNELGFGSDLDVMFVYRPTNDCAGETAQKRAEEIVTRLQGLAADPRLSIDLDMDLRPEGKQGVRVRSIESYQQYYERWGATWESQALLRANVVAGSEALAHDMTTLINEVRYPQAVSPEAVREIRRMKARVETERLPQGADPARHLKLGRGSLSDVEWLIQLWQLQHAARIPGLRTTRTLEALDVATGAGLIDEGDAARLSEAWLLASQVRSAATLWNNRSTDVLPMDRFDLDGVARLVGMPAGSASALEERYLGVTRRARAVFERLFFDA